MDDMQRASFIVLLKKFYSDKMTEEEALHLIRAYCKQYGNDEHKEKLEEFISILKIDPMLRAFCLKHAIKKYELKFSVVKIHAAVSQHTFNGMYESLGKIITVY